ncbi:hypothetical protein DOM22_06610 [Bdellovibrio sp. ZAP7]|uniref:hypothetical protein n=1 Tax=Bdellovibrio sp. ZAP7 TaxID=2231053 RepID=UPI0011595052|nr:hypothetical protein [Bdellovibrio sp. ZAP7]QDK44855.1 hypothetical protein DOM22_06610 [Bdellovibrio sp. ZAP7]
MVAIIKLFVFVSQVFASSTPTPDWDNCKSDQDCILPRLNFSCRVMKVKDNIDFKTVISYSTHRRECERMPSVRDLKISTDDYVGSCVQKKCMARLIGALPVSKKELPDDVAKLCQSGDFADYGEGWLAGGGKEIPGLPRQALYLACKYPDGSYFISCISYSDRVEVSSAWAIKTGSTYKQQFDRNQEELPTQCPPHPELSKEAMVELVKGNGRKKYKTPGQ